MTTTTQNLYSCTQCDYETTNKYSYGRHLKTKLHLRRLNSGVKHLVHACSVDGCDYITKNKSNFNRHMQTHSDTIIHTVKCVYCNMTFRDTANAKIHKDTKQHGKRTTALFQEQTKDLDQKELMMKTEKGENLWFRKRRLIREKIRKNAFIAIKIEVPRISKKKKTKDETNKKVINKKLSFKELQNIKDNYFDYDESVIDDLIFTHPEKPTQQEFKEQFEQLKENKLENENYQNDLYDLILEITEDIICILEDDSLDEINSNSKPLFIK